MKRSKPIKSIQHKADKRAHIPATAPPHRELDRFSDSYTPADAWTNRLIRGDSLLCMTSLLEREGREAAWQSIHIYPPYGIKYGANWQVRINSRSVTDGQDD